MFQAVDRIKLFNWLRRRGGNQQSSSNTSTNTSTTPDSVVAEKSVPAAAALKKPSIHSGFTSLPNPVPVKPPPLDDSSSLSTSPRHTRWLKKIGVSDISRKGSPTRGSISSLPDWSNDALQEANLPMQLMQQQQQRGGTFSTMGSPWNSKAAHSSSYSFDHNLSNSSTVTATGGGHSHHQCHNSYRRRRKYKQGHWVTTDTDYVVLEL